MKKIIALVIIVCLLFAGAVAYTREAPSVKQEIPAAEEVASEQTVTEEVPADPIDYEAMYRLHTPDETVLKINGKDVSWTEYYYWFYYYTRQISNQIDMMKAYYGMDTSWDDEAGADGVTYADVPALNAESQLKQIYTITGFAEDNNVQLTDEDKAEYEETLKADIASVCGEDGTQKDFEKVLSDMYMNMDIYRGMTESNLYYTRNMIDLYGENAEKITDEEAIAYLEENGYISANHILLMTADTSTGETVDEDTENAIEKHAQEIAAELQAIEDVEERIARFKELAEEFNEDPGLEYYPEGYTYTAGTMVSEFESAAAALEEYEVSDAVKTNYGYHIIMKMPLNPEALLTGESTPTPVKTMVAAEKYTSLLDEYYENLEVEYVDGFKAPQIKDYMK